MYIGVHRRYRIIMDPMPCKSFHQKEGVAHKPRIKMNNKKIAENVDNL